MEADFKLSFLANQATKPETGSVSSLKAKESGGNKSFESTLSSKRKEAENERNSASVNNDKNTRRKEKPDAKKANMKDGKNVSDAGSRASEAEREKVSERKEVETPDGKNKPENVEAETAKNDSQEDVKFPPELADEVTAQIAEVLGVSPEQVVEALKALNIGPEGLSNQENVNSLVMAVNEMSEPAELLKIPNLQEMQKEIKDIIAEAVQKVDVSEGLGEATVMTADATQPELIAMEIEKVNKSTQSAADTVVKTEGADLAAKLDATDGTEQAEEEISPETLTNGQTEQAENGTRVSANNAQNGSSSNAGGEKSFGGQTEQQAIKEETTEQTPIIIQKVDETVVEAGGKTISRVQQRPVEQAEVLNQIIDKMKLELKPGTTEMKINLRPDELGSITVKIATESGRVTAEIVTENSKIKELVEENIETLKESLRRQGVDVGELSVSVGQQESDERMKQFMSEKTKSHLRMSRIINKITGEETGLEATGHANEAELNGSTVDFSA